MYKYVYPVNSNKWKAAAQWRDGCDLPTAHVVWRHPHSLELCQPSACVVVVADLRLRLGDSQLQLLLSRLNSKNIVWPTGLAFALPSFALILASFAFLPFGARSG